MELEALLCNNDSRVGHLIVPPDQNDIVGLDNLNESYGHVLDHIDGERSLPASTSSNTRAGACWQDSLFVDIVKNMAVAFIGVVQRDDIRYLMR